MVNVECGDRSTDRIRNVLNDTTGMRSRESHYPVDIRHKNPKVKIRATFAWGDPSRALLQGLADYPPVF